jgi:hypothetical protein
MPSDANTAAAPSLARQAIEALSPRVETFHSAVATAEEEIRTYVAHRRGASEFKTEQALVELGPFALGLIDAERFATLLMDAEDLSVEAEGVLDRAEEILSEFAVGTEFHRVVVEPGGDLRDTVKDALDHVGQVFGASRAVELARGGLFDPGQHNHFLSTLAFRKWNRAERQLAPPLVVEVEADDLLPAGLGEFLDGLVKIVLVVRGVTGPAPLARFITPGTFVVQTSDAEDLIAMAAAPHPGIALLFDEERKDQARFVHDPEAGESPAERLTIHHMPESPEVGRGRRSPRWLEELEHLRSLARRGAAPPTAAGEVLGSEAAPEEAMPADQPAACLLSQTDLTGV